MFKDPLKEQAARSRLVAQQVREVNILALGREIRKEFYAFKARNGRATPQGKPEDDKHFNRAAEICTALGLNAVSYVEMLFRAYPNRETLFPAFVGSAAAERAVRAELERMSASARQTLACTPLAGAPAVATPTMVDLREDMLFARKQLGLPDSQMYTEEWLRRLFDRGYCVSALVRVIYGYPDYRFAKEFGYEALRLLRREPAWIKAIELLNLPSDDLLAWLKEHALRQGSSQRLR